ncbi:MAG TPA: hypothetical protein VN677_06015 [Gemmatimonadaceae bacterium]|jgi:hypothetical protein|nr:hypothetical protein [Gemmatimonadaceae bacterium]
MLRGAGRFAGLVGAVVLVACATGYPAGMAGTATPAFNGVRDSDGTTSLDEDELHADGRNLLDVLQQRLPNMTVSQDGDCPEVNLRGKSTVQHASNPAIYVGQERAANTCILLALNTFDIGHVEVYPSGIVHRPGYLSSPYGVIILFMRKSAVQ